MKRRSPLVLIFLTVFIDLLGFGLIYPLLPVFARDIAAHRELIVGLLLASCPAMQFVFVPVLGRLSDRVGRKPVLLFSVLGSLLSYLLMGYALLPHVRSLPLLFASQILNGISGANIAAAQAYIADVTPPRERAKGMGLIGAAFGLGFTFGPAVGGILGHYDWAYPAFAAAAISALNAVGIWRVLPESLPERGAARVAAPVRSRLPIGEIARHPAIVLPVSLFFLAQFSAAVSQVAFPLFMSDADLHWRLSVRMIGYGFLYVGLVVAFIQGRLIGKMVKRWGEARVTWLGLAVLAASYVVFPRIYSWTGLFLILAAMAFGQGSVIPALSALVSHRASAEEQGTVLGINQSMASLARVLGPVWAGYAYSVYPAFAYYTAGGVLAAAFLASLALSKRA